MFEKIKNFVAEHKYDVIEKGAMVLGAVVGIVVVAVSTSIKSEEAADEDMIITLPDQFYILLHHSLLKRYITMVAISPTHYHVSIIGSTNPIPAEIHIDKKSADQAILKMTEMVYTHYGVRPVIVLDGVVHLDDGSYIRKRGCIGHCPSA